MANGEVEVAGLSELNDVLQTLPVKLEQNILRSAMRKGQNVIKKAAISRLETNGSVDTGALKKSIRVSVSTRGGKVKATVKAGGKSAFYARFVEFGHFVRGKGQALRGGDRSKRSQRAAMAADGAKFVPAKPFMRPAFDGFALEAIDEVAKAIKARLDKEGIKTLDRPGE